MIDVEDFKYGDARMNRIKEIMRIRDLTQNDLSRMTGISQGELSRIINERKNINLDTAKRISRALGYSVEYIWPD